MRVRFLVPGVAVMPGEERDLPTEAALHLIRGGAAEPVRQRRPERAVSGAAEAAVRG